MSQSQQEQAAQARAALKINKIRGRQYWNEASMVDLLTRYIVSVDGNCAKLAEWLEHQASLENQL